MIIDRLTKDEYPEIPYVEVIRYLGWYQKDIPSSAEPLINECIFKISEVVQPVAVYDSFGILSLSENEVKLDCMCIKSRSLAQNLEDCYKVYIFAATIGVMVDRIIRGAELTSILKAAVYQAAGAAAVESYANMLNDKLLREVKRKGESLKKRFSPGYGDFPLAYQLDIFRILDVTRKIGISLTDGLLMIPTKSITALIGVKAPSG